MYEQIQHPLLPQATHDERARQHFVHALKEHLATTVSPGNRVVYEKRAKPRFVRETQRAPQNHHEVRRVMKDEPYYQIWSALQRISQEMMWDAVASSVERQLPDLVARAKQNKGELGSLTLNPDLPIPPYHTAVDIHCQPGGYHSETCPDDVAAGAIYDRAVHIYVMGRMGPLNDDLGQSLIAYLKTAYPDLQPRTILDLGCAVGHSTLPYVDAYPDAEVYAIDVAAPMLRYAHARAQALGKRVHFSQQNAERTTFADASFDLIVSHILLHETSASALRNIMRECYRLLVPGGMMFHVEVPQYGGLDPYDAFMLDWDTYNNNEPFWGALHEMDLVALASEAGFAPTRVVQTMIPSALKVARSRTGLFQGGDFAGRGQWFVFGAAK
ncbi:MAG: class I SAM-dependent methyltransferase [Candidatus Binatia bacterium]|nr:class I SAM-dependent methyltransferase [Candidatus Binatia bacterium]